MSRWERSYPSDYDVYTTDFDDLEHSSYYLDRQVFRVEGFDLLIPFSLHSSYWEANHPVAITLDDASYEVTLKPKDKKILAEFDNGFVETFEFEDFLEELESSDSYSKDLEEMTLEGQKVALVITSISFNKNRSSKEVIDIDNIDGFLLVK